MKIEKCCENQENFQIIDDLIRCLKIYNAFNYIYQHQECTVSEILKSIDICKSTLYDYIDKANNTKLIIKDFNNKIHKNGSQFTVVAKPELLSLLVQFKTIILGFLKEMSDDQDNL